MLVIIIELLTKKGRRHVPLTNFIIILNVDNSKCCRHKFLNRCSLDSKMEMDNN